MPRQAVEDYLKATLALSETGRRVSTSALAQHLGVKPSSVTAMVTRLSRARPRLVDYKSHQGFRLTKAGTVIALDVVRRHRLIEQFLVTVLDYGWDEVHDEAHRLEHCVTPAFVDRIDRLLAYPDVDPHGRPIPRKDGQMVTPTERPLSEVQVGEVVRVSSVRSEEAELLQHLTRLGLILNASVRVLEVHSVDALLTIAVCAETSEEQHVVGGAVTGKVYVAQQE